MQAGQVAESVTPKSSRPVCCNGPVDTFAILRANAIQSDARWHLLPRPADSCRSDPWLSTPSAQWAPQSCLLHPVRIASTRFAVSVAAAGDVSAFLPSHDVIAISRMSARSE